MSDSGQTLSNPAYWDCGAGSAALMALGGRVNGSPSWTMALIPHGDSQVATGAWLGAHAELPIYGFVNLASDSTDNGPQGLGLGAEGRCDENFDSG